MTQFQSTLTIVFSLSIFIMAIIGQAKISVLILLVALIASVITVLYGVAKGAPIKQASGNQLDWS